jgi:acetyl-CoA carboxylase carboxyl transferase alpha subunit
MSPVWATVELARHPERPYSLDYIRLLCDEFIELHGDRAGADDPAIVGGPARINGRSVMLIAQQKGRTQAERLERNYGMAHPTGYRKALRLMRQADRFRLPLVTLIDTSGAYPGVDAERTGQAWAISDCLTEMAKMTVPIVAVIIGEGGSGGALALGVADRTLMLENAIYSVASPEAAAAITWRDSGRKRSAAAALGLTSADALRMRIVDEVIPEPQPAHLAPSEAAANLKEAVVRHLAELEGTDPDRLLGSRYWRFRRFV